MVWGNFYYVYMARKLAYKEKRGDVCAMPYGINTPGACIIQIDARLTSSSIDMRLNLPSCVRLRYHLSRLLRVYERKQRFR